MSTCGETGGGENDFCTRVVIAKNHSSGYNGDQTTQCTLEKQPPYKQTPRTLEKQPPCKQTPRTLEKQTPYTPEDILYTLREQVDVARRPVCDTVCVVNAVLCRARCAAHRQVVDTLCVPNALLCRARCASLHCVHLCASDWLVRDCARGGQPLDGGCVPPAEWHASVQSLRRTVRLVPQGLPLSRHLGNGLCRGSVNGHHRLPMP